MGRSKNHIPLIPLILGALSCYRLAILIAEDDGPGDIFRKLRQWTDRKRKEEQDSAWLENYRGKWTSIDEGVRCPYCVGVWMALFVAILVYTGIADFILLFLGIAGAQAFLQGMRKE